jgi:endo-1,4-beta-xylanase
MLSKNSKQKKTMIFLNCIRLSLFFMVVLFAQTEDPKFADYLSTERAKLPNDGVLLYNCAVVGGYNLGAGNSTAGMQRFDVAETHVPFTRAYRITVIEPGSNSWEPQFQTPPNSVAIKQGDMLFWVFWARGINHPEEEDRVKAFFYAQLNESPWSGIASFDVAPGSDWQKFYVYGTAPQDFPDSKMVVTFHLGYFAQIVEFGGFIALNLGSGINTEDLPKNGITYPGREANAHWRAEASNRIEQYRKANLKISVKNLDDEPMAQVRVRAAMQEHAFHFGSFVDGPVEDDTDFAKKYEQEFLKLFNAATTPFYMGDGNWGWYASPNVQREYRAKAAWTHEKKVHTKGHVLIWPGWTWMTPEMINLAGNPEALRQALLEHLETIVPVGRATGLIQWDVVNEPYTNHDVMDILGDEVLIEWYQKVHQLHPEACLILNETGVITGGGNPQVQDNLERIIELLQTNDAPLHGIGFQGHFGASLTSPTKLKSILDRFAVYGLPIQITEFDVDIDDEKAQADYTRDFLTLIYSHPIVDKFIVWGFYEPIQWKPRGAMIRESWGYKPNYYRYMDLVYNQWWTEDSGATSIEGVYQMRGFLGRYNVSAYYKDFSIMEEIELQLEGKEVELTLPTYEKPGGQPERFKLYPNYPNPFNPGTTIPYELPRETHVSIIIYSLRGEAVVTLVDQVEAAGYRSIEWQGRDRFDKRVGSGIYFCQFRAGSVVQSRKLLYLR